MVKIQKMIKSVFAQSQKTRDLLSAFGNSSVTSISLLWGDMDAFSHLNNTVMLRYFETARINHLSTVLRRTHTQDQVDLFLAGKAVGPIVKSLNCTYRKPVVFPDTLHFAIHCPVNLMAKDRMVMQF